MTEIHPVPADEPKTFHISPTKAVIFTIVVCGIIVLGVVAQKRPPLSVSKSNVLGEETQTIDSYIPDDIKQTVSYAKSQQNKINPESLFFAGKDLLASAAGAIASEASKQTGQIASDAANNISDFVYKNTIEHIIDGLIQTLPENRQKQYNR